VLIFKYNKAAADFSTPLCWGSRGSRVTVADNTLVISF